MSLYQIPDDAPTRLRCPFCGGTPDHVRVTQGEKWCGVACCIEGPEVRTGYVVPPDDETIRDAIEAWNTRVPETGDEDG